MRAALSTDDEELAGEIRILRDLGQRKKYEHVAIGGNERLDTLHAAVLRVKLRHLADLERCAPPARVPH